MIRVATLCLYERDIDAPIVPVTRPAGVELSVWDSPAQASGAHSWYREAERRIREGQAVAVVRQGGDVVAYCWLTRAPEWVAEIGRRVVPGPDEVYLYDAFTVPEWRGRRLFPAMLGALVAYARTLGKRRALIFVLSGNRASRRAIERGGFELFLAVSRLRLVGFRMLWFRGPRAARQRVTLVASGRR
jgi:RimJ/RimL family protein N-acetyltransferase